MPDIGGIPYVDSSDLVSGWPTVSQSVAQEVSDQLASKQADVMTTKGDLAAYGTAVARLGVGTNGQVLTADSGETLGMKWAEAGALQLIDTTSIGSGVSSISVNGVFTASYNVYRVIVNWDMTNATNIGLRLRVSGTDNNTSNSYVLQGMRGISTSATAFTTTSDIMAVFGASDSSHTGVAIWDFWRPNLAQPTRMFGTFFGRDDYIGTIGALHNQSTAYDGFTLIPAAGTLSGGTIRVYGYIQ